MLMEEYLQQPVEYSAKDTLKVLAFENLLRKMREKERAPDEELLDYVHKLSNINEVLDILEGKQKKRGYEIIDGEKRILYEKPKTVKDLLMASLELGLPPKRIPLPITPKPQDIKSTTAKELLTEWGYGYNPYESYQENINKVYQQLYPEQRQEFLYGIQKKFARQQKLPDILKKHEYEKVAERYGYIWDDEKDINTNLNQAYQTLPEEKREDFIKDVYATRDRIRKGLPDEEQIQEKIRKDLDRLSNSIDIFQKRLDSLAEYLPVDEFDNVKNVKEIEGYDKLSEEGKKELTKLFNRYKRLQKRIDLKLKRAKELIQLLPEEEQKDYEEIFDFSEKQQENEEEKEHPLDKYWRPE